MTWRRRS